MKKLIRTGKVTVDTVKVVNPDLKVPEDAAITVDGAPVKYSAFEYIMLHKPSGYLTAVKDPKDPVVMELVGSKRPDLSPVGRLDKDTEGLLLITNDGALSHALLSPKKEIPKTYYFETDGELPDNAAEALKQPIVFKEFTSKPAELMVKSKCSGVITVTEGKYHEVKRLIHTLGVDVTYLKRISFGPLSLGTLEKGKERPLTDAEIEALREAVR